MSAAAASSEFPSELNSVYPSYQQPQTGPWGQSMNKQLDASARLNTPFSQRGWEEAKSNGCLPPPCRNYPTWNSNPSISFIYPSMQKNQPEVLLGENRGCFEMAAPFVDSEPILPSVEFTPENFNGQEYDPATILGMYNCLSTPQPIDNQCFGYVPYDKTYTSAMRSDGVRASGWLNDPYSPVKITSETQPVAVRDNIPSNFPSDHNEDYGDVKKKDSPSKENFTGQLDFEPLKPIQSVQPNYPSQPNQANQPNQPLPGPPKIIRPTRPPLIRPSTENTNNVDSTLYIYSNLEMNDQGSDDDRNSDNDRNCEIAKLEDTIPCIGRTMKGFMYDLFHPHNDKEDFASWLFRGDRVVYVMLFVAIVVVVFGIVKATGDAVLTRLYWAIVISLLMYWALPAAKGVQQAKKLVLLFIITVLVWGVLLQCMKKRSQ